MPHEFQSHGRTFSLTELGVAALQREIPDGVMQAIMTAMMQEGPITSTDIVAEYTSVEPMMLKRVMDEAISKGWVETLE